MSEMLVPDTGLAEFVSKTYTKPVAPLGATQLIVADEDVIAVAVKF